MGPKCFKCGEPFPDAARKCPNCGNWRLNQSRLARKIVLDNYSMPLKWLKFLIYFGLFFIIIANLGICAEGITGFVAPDKYIYSRYIRHPELRTFDIIDCAVRIITVIAALVVLCQLSHFRKNAPKMYLLFRLISQLWECFSLYFTDWALTDCFRLPSDILTWLALFAVIYAEYVYFKKRRELFQNDTRLR